MPDSLNPHEDLDLTTQVATKKVMLNFAADPQQYLTMSRQSGFINSLQPLDEEGKRPIDNARFLLVI